MKIGIFGGTFDPVHQGHLVVARHVREQFCLDRIYFIPVHISPHKTTEVPLVSGEHRLQMLELAIQNDDGFYVSDLELKREGISYTVDTVDAFLRDFPNDTLYLILGADSYQHFSSWKNPEKIENGAHILIAPRPDFSVVLNPIKATEIKMKTISVSASEIREKLKLGEFVGELTVPGEVLAYIRKQHLYEKVESHS